MSRLNDNAAMSWAEIGKVMGVSAKVAQKIGDRAMVKLRAALEREGITHEVFLDYLRMKDNLDAIHHENIAAITAAGEPAIDPEDPKPWTKLRASK